MESNKENATVILTRLREFYNQAKADGGVTYAAAAARIAAKAIADPTRLSGHPAILERTEA